MAEGTQRGDDAKDDDERLYSLPGGAMCGGCEIVRPLGSGAYGEVYLAVDAAGAECAIKRMQLKDLRDKKTRQRFLQEASLLKYITHPNVVKCGDYGAEKDGTLWMKLEYLQGATLRELLHARGRLPLEQVLRLGRQACMGLSVLHRSRGVHRDVKPENLFLIESEVLKVLDFGLVKLSGASLKTTGRVALGTALYFAPDYLANERTADDHVDVRWDVYSLGITLYEMLMGHPFVLLKGKVPPPMVAAKMHLDGEIPDLGDLGVPRWAADPIMKALALDPNDRHPDATAFEKELDAAHRTALAEGVMGTIVPRSASARVRLGHATTEPDVVRTITRAVFLPDVAGAPAVPEAPRAAAEREGSRASAAPEASRSAASQPPAERPLTTAVRVGPQGTERMDLPGEWTRARPALAAAAPPPKPAAVGAAPVGQPLRTDVPASRTEPLDRSRLTATAPARTIAEGARSAQAPAADGATADVAGNPVVSARTAPPGEHRSALPADEATRDAAELAVWLKKGYLPPEVAARLGLSGGRATLTSPAPEKGGPPPAPRRSPRLWRMAVEKPLAVAMILLAAGTVTWAAVRRFGTSAPPASAEPITVPIQPPPSLSPAGPPQPATPADPVPPAVEPAASTAAPIAYSSAASTSVPAPSHAPSAPAPKPSSSRAGDLYGDDDVRPKPSPAWKTSATAKTAAVPASHPAPWSDKPPASVLPFGKSED